MGAKPVPSPGSRDKTRSAPFYCLSWRTARPETLIRLPGSATPASAPLLASMARHQSSGKTRKPFVAAPPLLRTCRGRGEVQGIADTADSSDVRAVRCEASDSTASRRACDPAPPAASEVRARACRGDLRGARGAEPAGRGRDRCLRRSSAACGRNQQRRRHDRNVERGGRAAALHGGGTDGRLLSVLVLLLLVLLLLTQLLLLLLLMLVLTLTFCSAASAARRCRCPC